MLTGSLHQRRGFMATPPDTHDDGPRDDDVTKSESDSMDQSQDGPPSTLLADDHQKGLRDPGSLADVDPDPEDISRTLVLFSPGDVRKSPNSGDMGDGLGKELPFNEKTAVDFQLCILEKNKPEQEPTKNQSDADGVLLNSLKQECNAQILTTSMASPFLVKEQKNHPEQEVPKPQCEADDVGDSSLVRQNSSPPFTSMSSMYSPLAKVKKNPPDQQSSENENKGNDEIFSLIKHEYNQATVFSAYRPFTNVKKNQTAQEPLESKHNAEDLEIFRFIQQNSTPTGSAASPPFTKVEQTFIHIAEITHLNIMCSKSLPAQEGNPEGSERLQFENEQQSHDKKAIVSLKSDVQFEIVTHIDTEETLKPTVLHAPPKSQTCDKMNLVSPFFGKTNSIQREFPRNEALPETSKEEPQQGKAVDDTYRKTTKPSLPSCPRSKSRIPILLSEDSSGVHESLLTHNQMWKRAKPQDLSRPMLERQRPRSKRLSSRTSSSLISGDEPRRRSEAPSTTGSEEDKQQLDNFFNKIKKEAKEQAHDEWQSRIPRPATPIRRPSSKLLCAATSVVTLQGKSTTKEEGRTKAASNRLKKPQCGTSTRSKSVLTRSGSPRMPLRCIFTTSRSLSSTHRTDSPSPPRLIGRTTTNSQTCAVTLSGNQTKAPTSGKNTANSNKKQSPAAAR